jgi:HSP20 family protein
MNALFGPASGGLAELSRLQRYIEQAFRGSEPFSIRAHYGAAFPTVNVGSTPEAIEIMVMAPGLDASSLSLTVEKGVLTIAGERKSEIPHDDEKVSVYANERFSGNFRRVISLPDDVDPGRVDANYRDGLLRVTMSKRESSKPRRIDIN